MRRLVIASVWIYAATTLLEQVAALLRQLVHVAGWIVLLISVVGLVARPNPALVHLVVPGGGVLAVLQGLLKPGRQFSGEHPAKPHDAAVPSRGNGCHWREVRGGEIPR